MKRYVKIALILALCLCTLFTLASSASAADLKTAIGIVEANSGLRLRSEPSTSSRTITVAQKGDYVVIIEKDGDWYKVNYNLSVGYMHSDYLTVKERENVELGKGSIDYGVVNMRSGPSTSNSLLDQLLSGEKVEIFGFNCGWYKVRYDGQVGYIRSDLVSLLEKPLENAGVSASGGNTGNSFSDNAGGGTSSTGSGANSSSNSIGQQIATYAQKYVGYPYVYGGTSPSGFDCSGFVQYVYKQFGYNINRTATAQLADGVAVSYDELQPGDIIYFGYGSTASHVGIYIGGGQFVHAQNSGTGVVITDLSVSWYASRYLCAHRIVG